MNWKTLTGLCAIGAIIASLDAGSARADPVANFYEGKTVTMIIGFPAGGGFDLYGRLASDHWGRFLPGNPTFVNQNMEGAGSEVAARYLFNVASRDGTVVGIMLPHIVGTLLMRGDDQVRPAEFNWIGRLFRHIAYAVARHDAPVTSVSEAKDAELIIGATAPRNISATPAYALNSLVGTKFKVVTGNRGTAPLALALEQGELHAVGAISYELLNTRYKQRVDEGFVRHLWVLYPILWLASDEASFVTGAILMVDGGASAI